MPKGRKKDSKLDLKQECTKCKKEQKISNFYNSESPLFNGKVTVCKNCLKSMVNYSDMQSIYNIFQLMDIKFDAFYWEQAEKGKADTFSGYVRMANSLHQFKGTSFKDSVFEQNENKENVKHNKRVNDDELQTIDSQDNTKYYSAKWMGEYTQSDINYLETYYKGLCNDFKVATTSHKDYARKICKASLHMDKCFQAVLNGVSGADKRYKEARETFDTLSKSAQFSESQRGQNDVGLGGFGVTFDQVEKGTWIPKHEPLELDDIDKLLVQFGSIRESV